MFVNTSMHIVNGEHSHKGIRIRRSKLLKWISLRHIGLRLSELLMWISLPHGLFQPNQQLTLFKGTALQQTLFLSFTVDYR